MTEDIRKNNVKTLFLISNSLGFLYGCFMFCDGSGNASINGSSTLNTVSIVLGIWIMIVALIGYCGAIMELRKTLHFYNTCMIVFVITEISLLATTKPPPRQRAFGDVQMSDAELDFISLISKTVLTLVSLLLGLVMLGLISPDANIADNTDVATTVASVKPNQDIVGNTDKDQNNAVGTLKLVKVV